MSAIEASAEGINPLKGLLVVESLDPLTIVVSNEASEVVDVVLEIKRLVELLSNFGRVVELDGDKVVTDLKVVWEAEMIVVVGTAGGGTVVANVAQSAKSVKL